MCVMSALWFQTDYYAAKRTDRGAKGTTGDWGRPEPRDLHQVGPGKISSQYPSYLDLQGLAPHLAGAQPQRGPNGVPDRRDSDAGLSGCRHSGHPRLLGMFLGEDLGE